MLRFNCLWVVIAVIVAAVGDPRPVAAQPLTVATFPKAYREAEEKLYRKYVFNRMTKHRTATNRSMEANTQLGAFSEFMDISGENASRSNYLTVPTPGSPSKITGHLKLRDESYSLQSGDRPGTHKISAHRPRTSEKRSDSASTSGPSMYPLAYVSSVAETTTGQVLNSIDAKLPTGPQFKLLSVRNIEWQGKPVVEAKFEQALGIVNLLYLDPTNDLAFLGFESDGSIDPKTNKKGTIKMMGQLTYRPSDEGFPLPWKFETWNILPDGKRVPQSLSEVTEYVKYTPTADDFDLEKQFGVKPLPLPGTAAYLAASRSWRWLYAVAATGFAILSVLMILYIRRTRNKPVAH